MTSLMLENPWSVCRKEKDLLVCALSIIRMFKLNAINVSITNCDIKIAANLSTYTKRKTLTTYTQNNYI